jgi:hypothetical protein
MTDNSPPTDGALEKENAPHLKNKGHWQTRADDNCGEIR